MSRKLYIFIFGLLFIFCACPSQTSKFHIQKILSENATLKSLCKTIEVESEGRNLYIKVEDTSAFYFRNFVELKFTYILYQINKYIIDYDQIDILNILTSSPDEAYSRSFNQNEAQEIVNKFYIQNLHFVNYNEYMLSNFNSQDLNTFQIVIDDLNSSLIDFNFDKSIVELSYLYSTSCSNNLDNIYSDRLRSLGVIFYYNKVEKQLKYINYLLEECGRSPITPNDTIPFNLIDNHIIN